MRNRILSILCTAPLLISGHSIQNTKVTPLARQLIVDCGDFTSVTNELNRQLQEFKESSNLKTARIEEEIEVIEEIIEEKPLGYEVTIEVSYYCSCSDCCGVETGITASGTYATEGRTIALPTDIPFGTQIEIEDNIYTNEDTGSFIKYTDEGYMRVDIYLNSHEKALEYGRYVTTGFIYY